ncbi:MAG: hypothetical protein ACXWHZ_19395, partial [Usitatibacter sp.]
SPERGKTALDYATNSGQDEIVKILVDAGARANP